MNEHEFGRKIAEALNEGVSSLPEHTLQRLKIARREALEKVRKPARTLGDFRLWAPAAALTLAVAATALWQVLPQETEVADIDIALLSGDLPVYAYVDKELVRAPD